MCVIVVFVGPPGAGKGIQAMRVAASRGLRHVSTGELLRDAVEEGTDLGREASRQLNAGRLVPDDVMLALIDELLEGGSQDRGYVFDGFPRTVPQAEGFDTLLAKRGAGIDWVVLVDVDRKTAEARLLSRVTCPSCGATMNLLSDPPRVEGTCNACGGKLEVRSDDSVGVIEARFEQYERLTRPLVDYYESRGKLLRIDGSASVADVEKAVNESIDAAMGG